MSAGLISQGGSVHNFLDDLESSIYVLLWVTVMYSEVSKPYHVPPFLSSTLNPQCYKDTGGVAKIDFLMARSFLKKVAFSDRPSLHKLINDLSELISYRYTEAPSERERAHYTWLTSPQAAAIGGTPAQIAEDHICSRYDHAMSKLQDHTATIKLFNDALNDGEWPVGDSAVLQVFEPAGPSEAFVKSNFKSDYKVAT